MTVPYTFANRTGNIPLSELDANFSNVSAFSSTAGTVTSAAQPNIASVGTLSSLAVSGGISGSSLSIIGNIASGNLSVTGSVRGSTLSVTGNITGGNIIGTLVGNISNAVFANTAGTVTTNAQPNITSVGILSSLTATANITTSGNLIAVANINGGNIVSTALVRGQTVLATGNLVALNANISTSVNTLELNATTINSINIGATSVNAFTVSTTGNVTIGGTAGSPLKTKASGDTGTAGQITWDANYIYVCVATNTWKRASLVGF
jgi:hypothetical protein